MIRTDDAAPMPTSPPGNRVRSEVGRTPNSATLPQNTCCGLPGAETAQKLTKSGPKGEAQFWKTPAWLNVLYSLGAGWWLASRQVAQAHGRLVASSGNANRIGWKGARNESGFTFPY
jgi:hypothetical protein